MRIGKTCIFQSMKYVLPALALVSVGAFAIIKESSAATCSGNYYICYAATEGGRVTGRWDNNPISGETGSDGYVGNGAKARFNSSGYDFVGWKNDNGEIVSTNPLFIPCGPSQGCDSSAIRVQRGETYTAVFEANDDPDCSFYICYAVEGDGRVADINNDSTPKSGERDGNDDYAGNGAKAVANAGSTFIGWKNTNGEIVSTNVSFVPCSMYQQNCNAQGVRVTQYKTYTAYFESEASEDPTPATESIVLSTNVESGALEGNEVITLTIDGTPAPSQTSQTIEKDTSSVNFGDITITEAGSYRYRININNPYATAQPDAVNLEVKIDASVDASSNTIVIQKTYYKNDSEISLSDFVLNIGLVSPTQYQGSTTLSGVLDQAADYSNFSATMTSKGSAPAPSQSQGGISGASIDFGSITFTEPGVYKYNIELKNGDKTRQLERTIEIVFDRSSNALGLGEDSIVDEEGTSLSLDDVKAIIAELLATDPTPATESIVLPVNVESGALEGNEAITLSVEGTPAPAQASQTIKKDTVSVSFGDIAIAEAGSYRYRININNSYATAQPDAVNLEVKIDASVDANNKVVTQKTYYKNDSEIPLDDFVLNILKVAPTPLTSDAIIVNVIDPEADLSNFSATMTPVDGAPASDKPQAEIVDNTSIDFGNVRFTEPGLFKYDIELKNGNKSRKFIMTADISVKRSDNSLVFSDSQMLDEEGNSLDYEEFCAIVAELLAVDPAPDDPDDPDGPDGGDSDDSSDQSSDDSEVPNTGDSFGFVIPGAISAAIFTLGATAIVIKRR